MPLIKLVIGRNAIVLGLALSAALAASICFLTPRLLTYSYGLICTIGLAFLAGLTNQISP